MKTLLIASMFAFAVAPFAACNDVSHTETTKQNWDGSTSHQETTVTEHPDGSTSVDKSTSTTR